jgi:hypothetical protein
MGKCKPGCTCGLHRPHSVEHRRKISEAHKGKVLSEEHRRKNAEHLRRLAAKKRGRAHSAEHRRKISKALKGKPLSEEHRRKTAEGTRNPELKARRRAARIARRTPAESHRQVHKRLVVDRGAAKNYPCADCGEPAKDWSHDCLTWENVAQDRHGKRLTFSTDLAAYHARCQSCHNRLDSRSMPWPVAVPGGWCY